MIRKLLSGLALTVAFASVGQAQDAAAALRPITFGVKAGAALPMGDFGDGHKFGFLGGVNVGFSTPTLPVSFRIDGDYNRFSLDGVDGNSTILAFTGNAIYDFKTQSTIKPYVIGGVGIYNLKTKFDGGTIEIGEEEFDMSGSASTTKFGINGGAGIKIPLSGFNTFIEARYNHIFGDGGSVGYIPLFFGISF